LLRPGGGHAAWIVSGMRTLVMLGFAVGTILLGCNRTAAGPGRQVEGQAVETQRPHGRGQQPAFPGQTRAPYRPAGVAVEIEVVAKGLEHPWALAFLPDRRMLVTERPGRMRIVGTDGTLSRPLGGLPEVDARNQGGLLDVVLDPSFADNRLIYWSYSEPRDGGNGTAVARGRLDADTPRLEDVRVIWRMTPTFDSTMHFGSRLVFGNDGTLFVTTGERSDRESRPLAQRLDNAFGKVIRIQTDGSIPDDNPFVGREGVLPEIWSYGHRNIQAAALHPDTGELWIVDHGPKGGDEINVAEAGKNYGWPVITYGVEYTGGQVGKGLTRQDGMEQPLYYWDPVIAPSGMAFYEGALFPEWRGNLLVGGLAGKHIARLVIDPERRRVTGEERLIPDRARIRDVRVGPDGAVYAVTDDGDDEILRLVPAEQRSRAASR
jgi:aldose sugar dehydrogenase